MVFPTLAILVFDLSPTHEQGSNTSSLQVADALTSAFLLALVGVVVAWLVTNSRYFDAEPALIGYAVVFDLTLTAAACHWFLGIRLAGMPTWSLLPLLALCLFASAPAPASSRRAIS